LIQVKVRPAGNDELRAAKEDDMPARVVTLLALLALAPLAHAQTRERTGEEVVKMQCVKCHGTGANGAPRIDDRAAWIPRMKDGLDATVRSAMRGHGNMPARGGMAELSDTELRAAILYMFYPAAASLKPRDAAPPQSDPNHRMVGGLDIYLGIAPAAAAPVAQKGPRERGYYYINVSLQEGRKPVADAQVQVQAANAVSGGETKKLEPAKYGEATSYGNFFRMEGAEPYTIKVEVRRGKDARPVQASFQFKP
jgi:cytochrome c5